MKNLTFKSLLFLLALQLANKTATAQDSIGLVKEVETEKLINHEVGFNTVTLLGQLSFFEPAVNQQPYTLFYNIYYKDLVGLRLGAGMFNTSSQSEPVGEILPTITNVNWLNLRAGVSYNFIRHKRFTFNVFADYLYGSTNSESRSTYTMQIHPDPKLIVTNRVVADGISNGFQTGFGIKVELHKILCLYAELPINYLLTKTESETVTSDDGGGYDSQKSISWESGSRIILPSTIYLVLRF